MALGEVEESWRMEEEDVVPLVVLSSCRRLIGLAGALGGDWIAATSDESPSVTRTTQTKDGL
jgi:hypothetical protein